MTALILSSGPKLISRVVKANPWLFQPILEHHGIGIRTILSRPYLQKERPPPDGVTLLSRDGRHFPLCFKLTV